MPLRKGSTTKENNITLRRISLLMNFGIMLLSSHRVIKESRAIIVLIVTKKGKLSND